MNRQKIGFFLGIVPLILSALALSPAAPSRQDLPTPFPTVPFVPTVTPLMPTSLPTMAGTPTPTPTVEDVLIPDGPQVDYQLRSDEGLINVSLQAEKGQVILFKLGWLPENLPSPVMNIEGEVQRVGLHHNPTTRLHYGLFIAPRSATYRLWLQTDSSVGLDRTLTLQAVSVERVQLTERSATGNLNADNPAVLYEFEGQADDFVMLRIEALGFTPQPILMFNQEGLPREIANSFGSLEFVSIGGRATLPIVLPETGRYAFLVYGPNVLGEGNYTFSLDRIEAQTIAYGQAVEGEISPENPIQYYTFDNQYGDVVSIQAFSEIDTSLILYRRSYQAHIIQDDDGGRGFDPEIYAFPLLNEDTYLIELKPFYPDEVGPYTLRLDKMPTLDDGPQRISVRKRNVTALTLTAEAGEDITLNLRLVGGANLPHITFTAQSVETFLTVPPTSLTSASFGFVSPVDGVIVIQFQQSGESFADLEVSIERP